jgi:VWFA-related protein
VLVALLLLAAPAAVQDLRAQRRENEQSDSETRQGKGVRIPARRSAPLFSGKPGEQKTEISFDPTSHVVTLKLLVEDPNGYFIPNMRRDNFVVYENGVRQENTNVEIEHAAVSLGLLLEFGGRAPSLSRSLNLEIAQAGHQLLDELGREDKIAIWKYSDKVDTVADFSQGHETLDHLFQKFGTPAFSETNLYDALLFAIQQMRAVKGRKGIILITSGIDTFSKASFNDVVSNAQSSDAPIYIVSLAPELRALLRTHDSVGPFVRTDWNKVEAELEEIARVSGGRAYSPDTTADLSFVYDDIMENLRLRYVITYRSSNDQDLNSPRRIRVDLVDPQSGGPLQITDEWGRVIRANVIVQGSYVPSAVSEH